MPLLSLLYLNVLFAAAHSQYQTPCYIRSYEVDLIS